MQVRNTVLFIFLSLVVIVGGTWLQNYWFPPPAPSTAPKGAVKPAAWRPRNPQLIGDVVFRLGHALPTVAPGVAAPVQLASDVQFLDWSARERPLAARRLAEAARPKKPQARARFDTLGDDTSNLRVTLTNRGAAVTSVVLPQFKNANEMGLPTGEELALVPPDENAGTPSHLLYAYASPEADRPEGDLAEAVWDVTTSARKEESGQIASWEAVYKHDLGDLVLTKTYTLNRGDYHLGLSVQVERKAGDGGEPVKFRYMLDGAHGLPVEGKWYTGTFRDALIGQLDNREVLWRTFQDSRLVNHRDGGDDVRAKPDLRIQYAGTKNLYFASMVVVDENQEKKNFLAWARPTLLDKPSSHQGWLDDLVMRVVSEPVELKPGEKAEHKYVLYNGPVKVRLLRYLDGAKAVDPALVDRYENKLHLNTLADYHAQVGGFPGWVSENIFSRLGWTRVLIFFTNVMHSVLEFLYAVVPNYGVCIILLTVLVRGLMFPVSRKQALNTVRMQALQPELKRLQEKHKEDPVARQQAMMDLYRRHGINPFGTCWVILLQMPIFMGLYYALQESIHFRLAPFLWIDNLAAPDMLAGWGQWIPWLTRPEDMGTFFYLGPYFNLLPVIAVALMVVQQKLLTPPAMDEQQEMQMKMMKYVMIFFGLMFYKVAAGLCIYFIASSLWGLAERKMLPKAKPAPGQEPAAAATRAPDTRTTAKGPGGSRRAKGAVTINEENGTFQKVREMWAEVLKQARKK